MGSYKAELTKSKIDRIMPTGKLFRVWDTLLKGYHLRVSPSGTKSFVLRYHNHGRNLDYTIGKYGDLTPTIARNKAEKARGNARTDKVDLLAVRKQETRDKRDGIANKKKDKLRTLGTFFEHSYLPWAESNIKSYGEVIRLMKVDFAHLNDMDMNAISPWLVERMVKEAKGKRLANATINRRIATLKSILSKAKDWGVIESNPLTKIKPLRLDKAGRIRYLSDDEETTLRHALETRQQEHRIKRENHTGWAYKRGVEPPPLLNGKFTDHLFPIVLVAINTGMRRGEIFNLVWSDIDFKKRQLTVKGEGAKSGNTRYIPLNDEAFAALVGWRNQVQGNGLVFSSPITGGNLNNINKSWRLVMTKTKIKNFRFHDLRHTFASKLVMAGVDLNTVRELLGHASINMTLRYAHLAPEHKASAVALLNK